MAQNEIIEKLNEFFAQHSPISEECQVVYVMVQIRKLLDHDQDHWQHGSFTLLRFYCHWTVHTEKTRITESIKLVMDEVFKDIKGQIENRAMTQAMSQVMKFAYMENLQNEMRKCFEEHGVNTSVVEEDNWIAFVGLLVKVLENQPIHKPNEDVLLFSFLPAADRCVRGIVQFTKTINGYDHYNFGNAY
jgi:hypothetical protein